MKKSIILIVSAVVVFAASLPTFVHATAKPTINLAIGYSNSSESTTGSPTYIYGSSVNGSAGSSISTNVCAVGGFCPTWFLASWTTTNATSCVGSGSLGDWVGMGGTQEPANGSDWISGSEKMVSRTYTLTCTGPGGSSSATVNVVYVQPPTISSFTASQPISYSGDITLTWASTNSSFCVGTLGTQNPDWMSYAGPQTTSGSVTVPVSRPVGNYSAVGWIYGSSLQLNLRCYGPLIQPGTNTDPNTGRQYVDFPLNLPIDLTPSLTLTPSKSSVAYGDPVTLTWTTHNVTQCKKDGASLTSWSGYPFTVNPYGSNVSSSTLITNLQASQDFIINCYGPGTPSNGISATAHVDVTGGTITVAVNPVNSGTVVSTAITSQSGDVSYINCGMEQIVSTKNLCSVPLMAGTGLTLSAWPYMNGSNLNQAYDFVNWTSTDGTCSGSTGTNCGVVANVSKTITANFKLRPPTLSLSNNGPLYPGNTTLVFFNISRATTCTGNSTDSTGKFPTDTSTVYGTTYGSGDWANGASGVVKTPVLNTLGSYTYSLTCTGPTGTVTANTKVVVQPLPQGSVSLVASPTTVGVNGTTSLTWTPYYMNSCSATTTPSTSNGGWTGSKAVAGGKFVTTALSTTTTFTINCGGSYGADSASAIVTVKQLPIVTFTATTTNPNSLVVGSSVNTAAVENSFTAIFPNGLALLQTWYLKWSVSGATGCSKSNDKSYIDWTGSLPLVFGANIGNKPVTPAATVVYTLDCWNDAGHTIRTVPITVIITPPPTVNISAFPLNILTGSSSIISWTSTNATGCAASGTDPLWMGSSTAPTGSWKTGILHGDQTYVITCSGLGGTASSSVDVSVTQIPSVTLVANPNHVTSGEVPQFYWTLTNFDPSTDTCNGNSPSEPMILKDGTDTSWQAVDGSGSAGVGISASTTYTIWCYSQVAGHTYSSSAQVTIDSSSNQGGVSPAVTFFSNYPTVFVGSSSSLYWSSTDTTSCIDPISGSIAPTSNPSESTGILNTLGAHIYSITCTGVDGSSITATTSVIATSTDSGGSSSSDSVVLHVGSKPTSKTKFFQIPKGNQAIINWSIPTSDDLSTCTVKSNPSIGWDSYWLGAVTSGNTYYGADTSSNNVGVYSLSLSCSASDFTGTTTDTATLRITQSSSLGEI